MITEWYKVARGLNHPEEKRRAEICKGCDFRTKSKYLNWVGCEIEEIQGHYCSDCNCPLVAKLKTNNKKHICKKWL